MIIVPQSTFEKPLTAIDYIAVLEQCQNTADVQHLREKVPLTVYFDERFERAVSNRLKAFRAAA